MANKSSWIYVFVAGPVAIAAAYGISSVLTGGDSAGEADSAGMSLAYGVMLWIGAPIAFVAVVPILAGIVKAFTKS
ncbi:MAG: hypothetical protein P8M73_07190 [Luminiphilus sp.]|jgi:hypothetical protein|nr:hypothetical protein [Luminiphilus sp.]